MRHHSDTAASEPGDLLSDAEGDTFAHFYRSLLDLLVDAVKRVPPDSFLPVRIRRGLSMDDVAKVEEWKIELPGIIVEVEPQRAYPTSRFAAHLLGSVREASEEQMKQGRYRRGELVGRLDAKAHRRDGTFEVKSLHLEEGVRASDALLRDIAGAIVDAAAWHDTPEVIIRRTTPRDVRRGLAEFVRTR